MAEQGAIFLAASLGHVETCKKLVEGGVEVNASSEMVCTRSRTFSARSCAAH